MQNMYIILILNDKRKMIKFVAEKYKLNNPNFLLIIHLAAI